MTIVPNLIVSVTGKPKAGKTHFACTFPDPIKIFSFDQRARFVASKFPEKEIDVHDVMLPVIESEEQQWAEPIWITFEKDYKSAVDSGKFKTVVIDPATVVWQMCHQAVTESKNRKKILEVEYMKPNLKMTSLFSRAANAGINLVTIQYFRDRYVNGDNTGEQELDGWKRTAGRADINLFIENVILGSGNNSRSIMRTTIVDNGYERDLNGKEFDDFTYDDLIALLGV